jgi:hypothetical protein
MTAGRISPSVALAAYAEGWISGTKVVVFGAATSSLPERLLERGARQIQVYDADPVRVAEAAAASRNRQIAFTPLDQAGSAVRDGSFDFGIIEDLAMAGSHGADWLSRFRRLLSRRGIGLIASRNGDISRRLLPVPDTGGDPLGYYELYDAISQHFDEVRMLGQTAFVGYAIADFSAADEPEVRIDTAFVPGGAEEPECFLALVSALSTPVEAFSVIQLPFSELGAPKQDSETANEVAAARASAARIAELEAQLGELREKLLRESAKKADPELATTRAELGTVRAELGKLRAELAKREEWLAGLESRAATADQRADEMQTELGQKNAENAEVRREIAGLRARLAEEEQNKRSVVESSRGLGSELARTQKSSEAVAQRARELEAELRSLRQDHETLRQSHDVLRGELEASRSRPETDEEAQAELRELERLLGERGAEVTRLTEELHQTERFGRQLIIEVEQLKSAHRADATSRELARLAQRNAELEADLEAARWTISSLEANLPAAPTPSPAVGGPAPWQQGTAENASRAD